MIRLGPITIVRTSMIDSYQTLTRAVWKLHQKIWFAGEVVNLAWPEIMKADAEVSDALSHVPSGYTIRNPKGKNAT